MKQHGTPARLANIKNLDNRKDVEQAVLMRIPVGVL